MVKKSENIKKKIKNSCFFQNWSKNPKISKNFKKSVFFFKTENFEEEKKFRRKKEEKNAIPLVLPIEEISLRPELSSPARFRIQGGYPERDTGVVGVVVVVAGRHFSFLI